MSRWWWGGKQLKCRRNVCVSECLPVSERACQCACVRLCVCVCVCPCMCLCVPLALCGSGFLGESVCPCVPLRVYTHGLQARGKNDKTPRTKRAQLVDTTQSQHFNMSDTSQLNAARGSGEADSATTLGLGSGPALARAPAHTRKDKSASFARCT